jgi:AI-2 transport protein TqsA
MTGGRYSDSKVATFAVVIISVVVAGAALNWLAGILTPLALAIFLLVLIESFTRFLKRKVRFFPDRAALPAALLISVTLFLLAAWVVAEYATGFASELSSYAPRLNSLLGDLAESVGGDVPPTVEQLFEQLNPTRYLGTVAQGLQNFASNAVFVLVYLGFMIASRVGFERKVVAMFRDRDNRHEAVAIFERIRGSIESYLWVQTVTGLMIAAFSWAVMALVGLDNAFFWAFLIFVAGYIPIIGPLVGVLFPPIFGLVQFDSLLEPLILFLALNAINFIVGNIVYPRLQSDNLNLDPVVVLLSLAFWGAIWGLAGMFLSTPLTVMAMVILAQFKGSRWIAILLSANGDPLSDGNAHKNHEHGETEPAKPKNFLHRLFKRGE